VTQFAPPAVEAACISQVGIDISENQAGLAA